MDNLFENPNSDFGVMSYRIVLTKEQVELIKYKKIDIASTDGRTIFEVKDKKGNPTGEYVLYVIFTDK